MTQSIVTLNLLRRTAVLIGMIPAGAQLGAQDSNDMLSTLNEMLDSWSTESLSVYGQIDQEFSVTSGKSSYTWGVGGDWNAIRPVRVQNMSYVWQGERFAMREMTQQDYNSILDKDQTAQIADRWVYINTFPNGTITLFPTPSDVGSVSVQSDRILDNIPNLNTVISLPPGYLRALRFCLAVELWPEYPNPQIDINTIKAISIKAKANIKVANQKDELIRFDSVPGVNSYGGDDDWRTM
jgi:hypothetical protein